MLIHSVIYYRMDMNLIDDHTFDAWSRELAELQTKYPEIAKECVWAEDFEEFDGSSGAFLPINNPIVVGMAQRVLNATESVNRRNRQGG